MNITRTSPEEALASLHSRREGLSSPEAARRLAEYGPNRVDPPDADPLARRLLRQFTHFFALILWLAAVLAFLSEMRDPGYGMATLGGAIIGVILINGVFSFWQEYRAEKAIAALRQLVPQQVTVLRDAVARRLPAAALVPGDVVLVQSGDNVPADCRLLESFDLRVNIATVTGESHPMPRSAEAADDDDPIRSHNVLLAGTAVVSGEGRALVFATGMRTEFGKIAHLTLTAAKPPSPLQLEIARLSRLVAMLSTTLGVLFFGIGQALGLNIRTNLLFAIGIIVANVPEGLLPTVTLALAMATQRMARRNALIRHLPAAEALGSATVICTDKTGTLTQNRMSATTAFFAEGPCSLPAADAVTHHRRFFEVARHCHSLREVTQEGRRTLLGDPMEVALLKMAMHATGPAPELARVQELPFDADRMRMSTVHDVAGARTLFCKGALEFVLPLCTGVETARGVEALADGIAKRFLAAQDEMARQGLRILALAYRPLPDGVQCKDWENQLVLAGIVGLEDPPRPEVPEAIAKCRAAGIRVIMVTGDHPHTALAVARRIGLASSDAPAVATGEQLARMSDTQLQLALDAPEVLFARVSADQKMRIVEALKRKGHVVAVTGDGVNDAPALKRADIGIAMGIIGSDVARESADMILLDDNFASIVAAIEEGRAVFENIRKFLTYILTSNVPELVPYLAFALFRIPLPLTIVQILAVDLGTDLLPALALGAEKPASDTMQQPPRARNERLLSWPLLARAYLWLGLLEAAAAMAAFFFVLGSSGWTYGEIPAAQDPGYLQATSACLSTIIIMQVMNVFLCRHAVGSAFAFAPMSNPLILWGIAVELGLVLAIVYMPWGNAIFGTAPIPLQAWLFMLPFAAVMLLLEEARKAVVRRTRRGQV